MAIPSPRTWTDGETVTGAMLNSEVRDAINFLLQRPLFRGRLAGGVALTANTTINWTQTENIGGGTYSAGSYTAPLSGLYRFTFSIKWNTTTTATGKILVNGTAVFVGYNSPSQNYGGFTYSYIRRLTQGDIVTSTVHVAMTTQDDGSADNNMFAIEWIQP